ncbi:MAG: hypothetical protein IJI57_15565 [Flexilinea sp.]|nr:hypothetical protein [Flexilinea sp.]
MGTPPDGFGGGQGGPGGAPMGTPPDGFGGGHGGPGGMPGGGSGFSGEYDAVLTIDSDTVLNENLTSTGIDENALLVTDGKVILNDVSVTRVSSDSTGGDSSSFYGVGAALLATGGTLTIDNVNITTDSAGGAGVFSYGDGVVYITNSTINTEQNTSGGIHVAGGGKLYAANLTVNTNGGSAAAIRSDRGSGTMIVDGGSYTSNGSGSPAVYVTADITIHNADLTATGSEALCLEGLNTVRFYDSVLIGNMPDLEQNDNTWTVILYQSMSGDSQVGQGTFTMDGGKLISQNGGIFYTTNTESVFVLRNVDIQSFADSEYFLRVTGNANQRGWGKSGANGADCDFTAIAQQMNGDVIWDSISTLDLYITEGSVLNGAVIDNESWAGEGGSGYARVVIDSSSSWIVTGNSTVTALECAGTITDAEGNAVSVVGTDGTVYMQGNSEYSITTASYTTEVNLDQAGMIDNFEEHNTL